jgi:aminopeptidase-like protein
VTQNRVTHPITITGGLVSGPPEGDSSLSEEMYRWASDLFPICRSITGRGTRETLRYLQALVPMMRILEVPSGTRAFDWEVPPEWNVRDAYIEDPSGRRIVDVHRHNLHLVGYSVPVQTTMPLQELQKHLYSLEDMPDAIPYVTSYYERRWGFCMSHRQRLALPEGTYRVVVDTTLEPGSLSYGEVILPGDQKEEIFLSTYVCHPSMANNEISGPVVTAALCQWLASLPARRFTYRVIFIPETIGSIVYLSRHLETLTSRVRAGFVINCVGDERTYSFVPSRQGDTLADRVALHVLRHHTDGFDRYTFRHRGSDERQYCSVNVNLPMAQITRSKYHEYPEYHTSLDDLSFISPAGLGGSFQAYRRCLEILEQNAHFKTTVCCEPQLGRRGLYPSISPRGGPKQGAVRLIKDLLAYADGTMDLIDLADVVAAPAVDCIPWIQRLEREGLLARLEHLPEN